MNRYVLEISYMGGPADWRILDDITLAMFLTENHKRLHHEGEGYEITSIGQYLGPGNLRELALRQVERYRDENDYLCWSYELTSTGRRDLGNDAEPVDMAFTVRIDDRA